jgi:hypothetical protein
VAREYFESCIHEALARLDRPLLGRARARPTLSGLTHTSAS